jgi:hypothetical protein
MSKESYYSTVARLLLLHTRASSLFSLSLSLSLPPSLSHAHTQQEANTGEGAKKAKYL